MDRATPHRTRALATLALLAGAVAIAASPLFVKVSETGPVATAFWRVALALPVLWAWLALERRPGTAAAADRGLMLAAGVLFAGDLAVWHWSILLTSVANATLLANLAPIFVTLGVWLFYRRRPGAVFLAGLGVALAGTATLLGRDFTLGGGELAGDCLGVVTAMFYAGYQLAVSRLRQIASTASIMAWSGLVTAAILLPLAVLSGEQLLPASAAGWAKLFGLALISQAAGQSLIAYAMAHLRETFSSVGLLLQPVMAAVFAWLLLGETLGGVQIAGAIAVLAGIAIAHRAEAAAGRLKA